MRIEQDGSSWGGTFALTAAFMLRDLASDGVPTTVQVLELNTGSGPARAVSRTVTYVEVGNDGSHDTLVRADGSEYVLDTDLILAIEVL